VVANHLAGVYWSEPALVAAAIFAPVVTAAAPGLTVLAAGSWYNSGPFGVALFFLISGFVIPISLDRQSAWGFLVARAFRIYPTYIIALTIELIVLALGAHHWNQPFTYHRRIIVANALLIADVARMPTIDLVNWTLMVELKFYLLMALLARYVRSANLAVLVAIGAFVLALSALTRNAGDVSPLLGRLLNAFETNALYVVFMLIGVVFSYHVRGRVGTLATVGGIAVLFITFVLCWPQTPYRAQFPIITYNYAYALAVFSILYTLRNRVPDLRVADFFASVSYPLYCVHALIGFSVMTLLITAGWNVVLATGIAFAVALAIAWLLHVGVEGRSQAVGKALAERWFPLVSRPDVDRAK
jgi:peptidoglycan/LPS O-acetylase OafA/YrhL